MGTENAFFLSPETLAELRDLIEWKRNFKVTGAAFVNQPRSATLNIGRHISPGEASSEIVRFFITDTLSEDWVAEPTKKLLMKGRAYNGTDYLGEEVVIRILTPKATAGDQLLAYQPFGGVTEIDGSTPVTLDGAAVLWQQIAPFINLFPVTVIATGGAGGGVGSVPTFTYEVRDINNSTVLGEDMAPVWNRHQGLHVEADSGLAYYLTDGTFVLYMVDEALDS
jgi:hypothetical protein